MRECDGSGRVGVHKLVTDQLLRAADALDWVCTYIGSSNFAARAL